jgi:uncharacterized membrane-anchored protein
MSPRASLAQHADRNALHNEIHARPPEPLTTPIATTHVVMLASAQEREASRAHLKALLRDNQIAEPDTQVTHLRVDVGAIRLRWELHTEFVTWTFGLRESAVVANQQALESAVRHVSQTWLAALPGHCLASIDLWALEDADDLEHVVARRVLHENSLVGSQVVGGQAKVFTDFMIHADGSSRFLVLASDLAPRKLGRLVQQLLEIETYRMAALLGLPVARQAASVLASAEGELASLAQAIRSADRDAEPALLDRLTRLAGQVESQHAATHSRFSASRAYFELLDQRVLQIQERPLDGLQTIGQFLERRLTPARKTCAWAAHRQDALSQRVSRVSNLLRTRVEIEQQVSSQALLATMNSRQDLQLKLQATVEGLSVAAITYYIAGLIGYLAKGGQHVGWPVAPETTVAVAIPIVAATVWMSLRRLHRSMLAH